MCPPPTTKEEEENSWWGRGKLEVFRTKFDAQESVIGGADKESVGAEWSWKVFCVCLELFWCLYKN